MIFGHSNYHDLHYDEIEKLGKGLNGPFASIKSAFELYKIPHAKTVICLAIHKKFICYSIFYFTEFNILFAINYTDISSRQS